MPDEVGSAAMDGTSICPRCNGAFACGARTALLAPCACFAVRLSDATRVALQERYVSCLCLPCLKAVQAECEAPADPLMPPAPPRMP